MAKNPSQPLHGAAAPIHLHGIDLSGGASSVGRGDPFDALRKEIRRAEKAGDISRVRDAKRRLCMAKLIVAENARARGPRTGRFGPGASQLFATTHSIGDDTGLRGV